MNNDTANPSDIIIYPDIDNLRTEVAKLRHGLSMLVSEHDELEIECKNIEMEYMLAIGWLESKVLEIEYAILRLKREISMIQALKNLQKVLDRKKIEDDLDAEFKEYKEKVTEQAERVNYAHERFTRRERNKSEREQRKETSVGSNARAKDGSGGDSNSDNEGDGNRGSSGRSNNDSKNEANEDCSNFESGNSDSSEDEMVSWYKRIYRKIVKALHPDVNTNVDDAGLEILRRANAAYEDGDFDALELCYAAINDALFIEDDPDQTLLLLKEKERLIELIQRVKSEIDRKKSRFPYTLKDFVNDPEKIAARKAELDEHIKRLAEALVAYQTKVAEMQG